MIILDTHIWIWWLTDPAKLSPNANDLISEATNQKEIVVSSISVWEIALLVKKDRLELTIDVTNWIAQSEKLPFLSFIPIDNSIVLKSIHLPEPFHDDPADRMIVATAITSGSPLITADKKIRNYKHVNTVW